jgi:hypothetical protein
VDASLYDIHAANFMVEAPIQNVAFPQLKQILMAAVF